MANQSTSIDELNDFIIHNFTPYAWAHLWETTMESKLGDFKFVMCVRPNIYQRRFVIQSESWDITMPSTNSLELMPPEFYSSYCVEIPMVRGYVKGKGGVALNEDSDLKEKYVSHMKKNVRVAAETLVGLATLVDQDKPFGNHFSKVKKWLKGCPKEEWSIFHNSICDDGK